MEYIELTVHTTSEASEIIADIMWNYTEFGVTICDRADIIALQTSKETTFWDNMDDDLLADKQGDVLVKCYLEKEGANATISALMQDIYDARERSGGCFAFGTLE